MLIKTNCISNNHTIITKITKIDTDQDFKKSIIFIFLSSLEQESFNMVYIFLKSQFIIMEAITSKLLIEAMIRVSKEKN